MNREIKYRGLNNETGQFVYGWYTKLTEGIRQFDAIISDIDGDLTRFYIHNSKTIGQFTGLKDLNGVEIFEGDVSRNIHHDGFAVKCEYNKSQHRWSWYTIFNDNVYCHLGEGDSTPEIIGSIYIDPLPAHPGCCDICDTGGCCKAESEEE